MFRILHRDNLRWTLCNGLHCASAGALDPGFVPIGNPDLIARRRTRQLPPPFEGELSDYVPFYFTPLSPMMYNVKTGYNGITKRANEEILILVSSFAKLKQSGVETIFSDRHAYLQAACFYSEPESLDRIDWRLLQARDFKRDPNDPGKFERYEAECLARTHVPVPALIGVACFNESAKAQIDRDVAATGVEIDTRILPRWYF